MKDTSPAARARYFELLRARSPEQRLAMACSLTRAVRQLAEADIRARIPEATEARVKAESAARIYGRETAQRLFGETSERND